MTAWQPTANDREILRVAWDRLLELGESPSSDTDDHCWLQNAVARRRRELAIPYRDRDPQIAALLAQLTEMT